MNVALHLRGVRSCLLAFSMATCSLASDSNSLIQSPATPTLPFLETALCKRTSSARRSLASDFTNSRGERRLFRRERPSSQLPASQKPEHTHGWRSLGADQSELSLALTLPTGQSFRWKLTGDLEYTGVVDHYLFTLRQAPNGVEYMLHDTHTRHDTHDICHDSHTSHTCVNIDKAERSLRNYLNLNISLKDVWAPFVAADARFAALAPHMAGARLLRQRPLECLFQFICSSNNHIQRISQMVDHLASLGPYLGTFKGLPFHAFPSLDTLAGVAEAELREAGFGYRAKYIVGAVKELQAKKGGGEEWLYSLRASSLNNALEELCSLPGIGPKVAACIALFSLDQHHAIPVDTHVWQIATTYITPELSGERLTPKLHTAVSEAFVKRFGKYAGWAQNVLFIAELSSHQLYLPEHLRTSREKKLKGKSRKKVKMIES